MRIFILLLFILPGLSAFSQEADTTTNIKQPYSLHIPDGWGVERFPVPPGFAPQIQYSGVEDIRFTPGWADKSSPDYWTYCFLWFLDGSLTINSGSLTTTLKSYYSGLSRANTDPKKAPPGGVPEATVTVVKNKTAKGGDKTFSATISMLDYMQLQPITLNAIIHLRYYLKKGKTVLFFELSPKPTTDATWSNLEKLWQQFSYK